jgi:DNA-binding NtrC family response regulator
MRSYLIRSPSGRALSACVPTATVAEIRRAVSFWQRARNVSIHCEAIRVLGSGIQVDLVFTDVRLPGEANGFDLVNWINAHEPDVKVMLTSGHVGVSDAADQLWEAGTFFAKPYDPVLVVLHIRRLLAAPKYLT